MKKIIFVLLLFTNHFLNCEEINFDDYLEQYKDYTGKYIVVFSYGFIKDIKINENIDDNFMSFSNTRTEGINIKITIQDEPPSVHSVWFRMPKDFEYFKRYLKKLKEKGQKFST